MSGPHRNSFGQRNVKSPGSDPTSVRRTSKVSEQASPHVVYREGQAERPTFHDSFIERHWPKFGAAAMAVLALIVSIQDGKFGVFELGFVAILAGAIVYFVLNSVRKKMNDLHTVRTKTFRSPRFAVGVALGFSYFLYSTFFAGPAAYDSEIAKAAAEFTDPLTPFRDGFQSQDFGALGLLILKAAGEAALGGLIVSAFAGRLLGEEG